MLQVIRTTFVILAAVLVSAAFSTLEAQSSERQSTAAPTPACALLSVAEIRRITGRQDYPDHVDGDAAGEGLGGGSSCQYGGETFMPGDHPPLLSVVLIPASGGKSWTEGRREVKPGEGCTREAASGIGDDAFLESCPKHRGPTVYVKAGANDILVQMDVVPPATAASVKPTVLAVAKAAVAKVRSGSR